MATSPHPRIEARNLDPALLPSYTPQASTDAALVEPVLAAIQAAVNNCSVIAAATVAGRIYTRKTEECVDLFSHPRNRSYGSTDDDFFLQVTVRVPHRANKPVMDAIARVETFNNDHARREVLTQLENAKAATAAALADQGRIQAELDRLEA